VSLLAGLDLHTSRVTEIVNNTHKSSDFIEFLNKPDAAYHAAQTLRLILDNHSAHISRETQHYLATRPQRFHFVFIPKHGSWLNLVENLFSKMTRTMLGEIRVGTKKELVDRIHLYFQEINATPAHYCPKQLLSASFPQPSPLICSGAGGHCKTRSMTARASSPKHWLGTGNGHGTYSTMAPCGLRVAIH
jgi:transposase